MEGTPQLLTDVKFSQHRKGYDPDEVDNFLERVSAAVAQLQDKLRQATERAEHADSQLAEARRLQAEAEARAGSGTGEAVDVDAELKKVLLMAQRAADQTTSEANAEATRTVADARAKSLALLAEAEAERDRMMEKARRKADATAEERARTLREQVDALQVAKDDLEADVATLDAYLTSETERLRSQLAALQEGLADPRGLRLAETPELRDTPVPVFEADEEEEAAPAQSSGSPVTDLQEAPVDEAVAADESGVDGIDVSGEPTHHESPEHGAPAGVPDASLGTDEPTTSASDAEVAIDLTTDDGAEADAGVPTSLFTPTFDEAPSTPAPSSPLGEPDEAADAAMRAFFEQDLDEDPTGTNPRPRFGRRR